MSKNSNPVLKYYYPKAKVSETEILKDTKIILYKKSS